MFLLFRVRFQDHLAFGLKHAWQVELHVLVDEESYAGRWHDPDQVGSESVGSHVLVMVHFSCYGRAYPL
jgi:hypothetical protein